MPAIVYPSERLFSNITVRVPAIRIDGDQLPEHNIDPDSRTIALYSSGRKDWDEAEVFARVEAPLQELKGKALDDNATHALVRINCGRTNLRSGELLDLKNGVAEVRLTLRREQVIERATLECFIVRDTDEGFARILRETNPWYIILSEPTSRPRLPRPPRPGGLLEFIDISWVDFRDSHILNGALAPYAREAYFLDIEADPPHLYLNEGIEGYHALLMTESAASGSQTENVFRDLENKRVALGVWLAACFEAISCIVKDDNGEIVPPENWRGEILKLILPRLFPGESLDAAYQKIVSLRGESGTSAYLLGKLEIAVNEHISTSTTLKKHLMALVREGST